MDDSIERYFINLKEKLNLPIKGQEIKNTALKEMLKILNSQIIDHDLDL